MVVGTRHGQEHGGYEIPELGEQVEFRIKQRLKKLKRIRVPPGDDSVWFEAKQPSQWFTGRVELMKHIRRSLDEKKCIVVYGKKGMGKTELIRKFVQSNYQQYNSNVIWISAINKDIIVDTFKRLAYDKLRPIKADNEDSNTEIVRYVYNKLAGKKCLFVFDNADNIETIREYLSTFSDHFTIITSKYSEWKNDQQKMQVPELTEHETKEFLSRFLKIEHEMEGMSDMVKVVQKFSLSRLHEAALYVQLRQEQDRSYSFKDYLLELKDNQGATDQQTRTIQPMLNEIEMEANGSKALELLDMISYIDSTDIPEELFADGYMDASKILIDNKIISRSVNITWSIQRNIQRERISLVKQKPSKEVQILTRLLELLKELLKKSESVEKYISHITELWKHAEKYDELITKYMLPPHQSVYKTFFHLLARSNQFQMENILCKLLQNNHPTLLSQLIYYYSKDLGDNVSIVKLLCKHGANVNAAKSDEWPPLLLAVHKNNIKVAEYLIDKGADVNSKTSQHNTSLHFAIRNNNIGLVKKILLTFKDVNMATKDTYTPLHSAAFRGFSSLVQILLKNKAKIDCKTKEGFTPLHLAVQNKHLKTVQILLKNHADVNSKTMRNWSPLFFATRMNSEELVKMLLKKGADVDMTNDKHHYTALHNACNNGNVALVRLLMNKKANLNLRDEKNKLTPFHCAVLNSHTEVVKLLVGENVDISAKTNLGNTALHIAAGRGFLEIVELLLTSGADLNLTNNENQTVKDLAYSHTLVYDYINDYVTDKKSITCPRYNKRSGCGNLGSCYEINLIMFFLLKVEIKRHKILLASNMNEIGNLDDIIFKYSSGDGEEPYRIIFLQAKHKATAKNEINLDFLLSGSTCPLVECFKSYLKIKKKFQDKEHKHPIFKNKFDVCEFVVFTNIWLKTEDENDFIKHETTEDDLFDDMKRFYKLSTETEERVIRALEYAADSKSLAKELIESIIQPEKKLGERNKLFRKYQDVLFKNMIKKIDNGRAKFKETFLSGENEVVLKFRQIFFDELREGEEFIEEDMIEKLKAVKLKFYNDFENEEKILSLPTDVVKKEDIKDFMSKLKLFVHQPNVEGMEKMIKRMVKDDLGVDRQEIHSIYSQVFLDITHKFNSRNQYMTEKDKCFKKYTTNLTHFTLQDERLITELQRKKKSGEQTIISGPTSRVKRIVRGQIGEVIHIDANDDKTMGYCFRNLADDILDYNELMKIKDVTAEVFKYFENKKVVFLFDNYADSGHERNLIHLAPEGIFKIFVNSSVNFHGENIFMFQTLEKSEAVEFIQKSLPEIEINENEAEQLADELNYLGLALLLATSCIKEETKKSANWGREQYSIHHFLQDFHQVKIETFDIADELKIVYETYLVVFSKIESNYFFKTARKILRIIAYLEPNSILVEPLFYHLITCEEELHCSVELLSRYSLVTLERGRINIHKSIQECVRKWSAVEKMETHFINTTQNLLFKIVLQSSESVRRQQRTNNKNLLMHFETLLSNIKSMTSDPEIHMKNIVTWTGLEAGSFGNVERGTELLEESLQMWQDSRNFLEVGKLSHILADNYNLLGEHDKQKERLNLALKMFKKVNAEEDIAEVILDITDSGELTHEEKIRLLEDQFKRMDSNPNYKNRFLLSEVAKQLGRAYEDCGDYKTSIEYLEQAVKLQEDILGKYHYEVAKTYVLLNRNYKHLGTNRQIAENYKKNALVICGAHYPPDHKKCCEIVNSLSITS